MTARGLIVAAARSGSGKTTVTLALLAALKRRGIAVRAAKVGPDYIDPAFHTAATGASSVNLDSWAMPPALLDALAAEATRGGQMLIVEGVMGLFDGVPGTRRRAGATADIAARFGLPVLLVLDVTGQSQTAAAVARGLATHDADVRIGGVVLNRIGSERHRALVADALAAIGIPVVGAMPRDAMLGMPERHLGLVQAHEHADLPVLFDRLADRAERHLDLDRIAAMAAPPALPTLCDTAGLSLPSRHGQTPVPGACFRHSGAPRSGEPGIHNHDGSWLRIPGSRPSAEPRNDGACKLALQPPGQRVALATDTAFTFVYPHIVDGWRRAGAEIVPFSPLAGEPPPESCDACWLPGGYPELHAGTLANAHRFHQGLRRFAETRPVHGECGGYMVLGEGLEDAHGLRHGMAGLLGHATSFAKRKLHLGYREACLLFDNPLGRAGDVIRGHEFHYATVIAPGADEGFLTLTDAQGRTVGNAGGRRGRVSGTFFHAIARG